MPGKRKSASSKPKLLYVATDGVLVKVGISYDIPRRITNIRWVTGSPFEVVRTWQHADPRRLETACRRRLRHRAKNGLEYFAATVDEVCGAVETCIVQIARGDAMRAERSSAACPGKQC